MSRTLRTLLLTWALAGGVHALNGASSEFAAGIQALGKGDYAEAYCRWKPLAERGHADAQYNLGWLYANGNGLAVSIDRALHWWRLAASQGHADAQFAVGLAYTTGEGMQKDLDEAVKWYLTAARQGHQDAREILVQLNGDPTLKLSERFPEVAREDWFGWRAKITGDRINLRDGPGTAHQVVAQLEKGTEVRVIGQHGDWYMVVMLSVARQPVAWVYSPLVSEIDG